MVEIRERNGGMAKVLDSRSANGVDMTGASISDAFSEKRQARAILRHDVFNLITLAVVNGLNCWYLLYGKGVSREHDHQLKRRKNRNIE
jgi:hypothetical protein